MGRYPRLDDVHREIEYCTFCPKLCRFACPVANAERRETTTPWGRQTLLHLVQAGQAQLDAELTDVLHRCLSCLRCREFCKHEIEVPRAMRAARALAREQGHEPAAVADLRDSFRRHGNPDGFDGLERLRTLVPERYRVAGARAALFLGCAVLDEATDLVAPLLRVLEGVGVDYVAVHSGADQCCGLPLYEAGDREAFVEHGRRLLVQLGGYRTVVAPCPACAYTLRALLPENGLEHGIEVLHVTEFLARRRGALDLLPGGPPTTYFDPCYLGRYLGVYEAPRQLLAMALGRAPREFQRSRNEAACCGGGSLVRRVAPATADACAAAVVAEAREREQAGGEILATACPRCRQSFRAVAGDLVVQDVVELLAERLADET